VSQKSFAKKIVWIRRIVQIVSLALFFWLFWAARLHEGQQASPWLRVYFDIDPLAALITWLASHELRTVPVLALTTVVVTILMGRVFCGWICPLGVVHNAATWFRAKMRWNKRPPRDAWSPWQRAKYYLLAGLLAMALFGGHWAGVFDPMPLLFRATATVLYPGAQYAIEDASTAVYQSDPHLGPLHLTSATEPVYGFMRDHVFKAKRQTYRGTDLIFLLFVAIVLLNLYRSRFWCRYVCPLGGLLGLCAQRPILRLKSHGNCTECGLCAQQCPAAASPEKPGAWRAAECFGCWNCVAACNRGALGFTGSPPWPAPSKAKLDLSRRALLSAGAGGVGGLVMFRLSPQAQGISYNPELIRPPGARNERAFLQRCLKCGLCMKACPTNGLHPTGLEAGLEGIWTPMMVPRAGYCEYNCNLCGQVCPTGAIQELALEEKKKVRMGLAVFDTTRCLPYAFNRECLVCEEHCPLPKKAIYFLPAEVRQRDGSIITLKQPHVDPDLCTGCCICEHVCVFKDRAAIRVTSANESRHTGNKAILTGNTEEAGPEPAPAELGGGNPYGS